jgi:DNA-binding response OmpR family regulator
MLGDTIEQSLLQDQHQVDLVRDASIAMDYLRAIQYDLAVLDWQLPGLAGIEICRKYRSSGGQTPIIMLTAMSKLDDKEAGLDSGADDYLTKSFELRELKARIPSLLRRPAQISGEMLQAGLLRVDTKTRQVTRADSGDVLHLKPNEYAVLEFFLLRHPNEVVSPELVLQRVWSTDSETTAAAVYICINRIPLPAPWIEKRCLSFRSLNAAEAQMITRGLFLALSTQADHIARTILRATKKRTTTMNAFLLFRFRRVP